MPWDVIANRVGHYLRIGYVTAVVAGLVLAAEVSALFVQGPSQHRRQAVATSVHWIQHRKINSLIWLAALAAAFILAYLLGLAARSLTFAVLMAVINAIHLTSGEIRRWWRGERRRVIKDGESVRQLPATRLALERHFGRARKQRPRPYRRLRSILRIVTLSLLSPFFPYRMHLTALCLSLDKAYGVDRVNSMLERHPINARITLGVVDARDEVREKARSETERGVVSAIEYCQVWLQRNAPDVAIPPSSTRLLVLATAALPAILLPATLRAIGADVPEVTGSIAWLRLVLLVGGVILFIDVFFRDRNTWVFSVFRNFVTVAMTDRTMSHLSDGHQRSGGEADI